jgi:hypothetical protein
MLVQVPFGDDVRNNLAFAAGPAGEHDEITSAGAIGGHAPSSTLEPIRGTSRSSTANVAMSRVLQHAMTRSSRELL